MGGRQTPGIYGPLEFEANASQLTESTRVMAWWEANACLQTESTWIVAWQEVHVCLTIELYGLQLGRKLMLANRPN